MLQATYLVLVAQSVTFLPRMSVQRVLDGKLCPSRCNSGYHDKIECE